MPITLLLTALLFLPQTQPHKAQLSNTFITATEGFLDDATTIDVKAPDASFNPRFDQLKKAKDNLKAMVQEDPEQQVIDAANDLIFAISACHLQANGGADTTNCQAIIDRARNRAMAAIDRHKANGRWSDGPPM